ncbi:MAG: response regulator [Acidobacteria bacterium]|nr:response regulator [Acidobacteriota bacterium]
MSTGIGIRVILVQDSEAECQEWLRDLRLGGYEPVYTRVETAEQFLRTLREKWDLVLSEFLLPRFGALEALRILNDRERDIPCIVLSREVSDRHMHSALKAGACDFVARQDSVRLNAAIGRELSAATARRDRRHLEEQLRHAQKLEAVGRLAGGVAHDFNNLLTIISGYSELLLAGDHLDSSQRTALEEIRRAALRGGAVTHRLLAFSRRQPMAARVVRMNDLVMGMEKILRRIIGEDIELVTLPAAAADAVKADPAQLEQVIMNLVVNARDAMPKGGKLTIESGHECLDETKVPAALGLAPGPYVVLTIGDTGVGMDALMMDHLFEPFYTTKAPGKGTGLGLATAYGIVRQSGGTITVESEPENGTTVRIYLPFVAEREKPEAEEPDAGCARGCETVLLVEDEPRVRRLISDVLTAKGYAVLEASRGDAALRVARDHPQPIHLVILDVVMPEMSGPEVGKRLRKLRPHTRLLYISGYTDEAMLQHGIDASNGAFLPKPFVPNALAVKVREVLDAPQAIPAAAG